MTSLAAGGLVFVTSAAVLVLEILAARLLAPYVGVTLEAYTAIIGTVLAGIAAGTWVGGYAADHVRPHKLLGPLLVLGGVLSVATVPLVRLLGGSVDDGGSMSVLTLSVAAFFLPAAVLSAVTPTVVKMQLHDLAVTGRVVGRLSGLGTAGAIAGTFLAGFVLIDAAPTTSSIFAIGALLFTLGLALWVWLSTADRRLLALFALLALAGSVAGAATGDACDVETKYHCARVVTDEERPGGRFLVLDTQTHSYVDIEDPRHLGLRYTKVFADVVAALAPSGPLDVLHIGGGGFTMPRYVSAVRPGSSNLVLEIDPGLVELSHRRLGLGTGSDVEVRVGDARLLLDELRPTGHEPGNGQERRSGHDVVLGDAFGGVAVPWHLTTVEFADAVRARLGDGGVYVLNVIDRPPLRFARAEVATLLEAFGHVAVVAPPALLQAERSGNFVLVASNRRLDAEGVSARIAARGGEERVLAGEGAAAFAEGASVLTDDHAPIDQWLARGRRP